MLKSGLIGGAIAFILVVGVAFFVPACSLCIAILFGLGTGVLAGVFDKPDTAGSGAKAGAGAGAIAGLGAIVGQLLVAVGLAAFFPEGAQLTAEILGQAAPTTSDIWLQQLSTGCILGVINIILMAALGAGGGLLWFQINKSKSPEAPSPASS